MTMGGKLCTLGGMCKGSGMIHPNMATMLCFLTTDAADRAGRAAGSAVRRGQDTFNMLSIDGDTSTNDMVAVLANGMAGNENSERRYRPVSSRAAGRVRNPLPHDGQGRRGRDQADHLRR